MTDDKKETFYWLIAVVFAALGVIVCLRYHPLGLFISAVVVFIYLLRMEVKHGLLSGDINKNRKK